MDTPSAALVSLIIDPTPSGRGVPSSNPRHVSGSPIDELDLRLGRARESARSTPELVDTLNELAWAVRQKDPQRSKELAAEARDHARELSYEIGLAWALRNSGHAHYRLADYAIALAESLEALEMFERLGLDAGRASAAGGVGMAYTRISDYANGLRYHRESLRIRRQMGDPAGEGGRAPRRRRAPTLRDSPSPA